MKKSKITKSALFSSMVALFLCFSMLLGTTFAWFTDSEVSGSNVITAGNLDIEVQYTLDGTTWADLDGATDLFKDCLWEPGYTRVVALKVENKGSLALKYTANMNIVAEKEGTNKEDKTFKLSDNLTVSTLTIEAAGADPVLGWDIAAMTLEKAFEAENSIGWGEPVAFNQANVLESDMNLFADSTHYVFVKVDMPETVGNEANHKTGKDAAGNDLYAPSIEFGLNVLATQFTYEEDSFGNDYDENATMPQIIKWDADENNAVNINAGDTVSLNMNDNSLNNTLINRGTLDLANGTINTGTAGFENLGNATLTNVDVNAGSTADYGMIQRADSNTTFNDVNLDSAGGGVAVVDGAKATFNSGSVAVNTASTSGRYNFYVEGEGSELTINEGTFSFSKTLNQKRAYIYVGAGATVYVNGGTFGPASTRSGYTAGILGDGTVIIKGGTFGFDPSAWVADGYEAVKSGSTWTVQVKV